MKKLFDYLVIFLFIACNNREAIVGKKKLIGYDYRLFQNTPGWELGKRFKMEKLQSTMKRFTILLLLNILTTVFILFLLLYAFFSLGSGSGGFNDKWYYVIIVVGILHFLTTSFLFKSRPRYNLIIPLLIFSIYLCFYFG
jgi:hypothetical protein